VKWGEWAVNASIILLSVPSWNDVTQFFADLTVDQLKHWLSVGRDAFALLVYFLAAVAAILGLWRINKILLAFQRFREASPDIAKLYMKVDEFQALVPAIESKILELKDQMEQRYELEDTKTIETAAEGRLPPLDLPGKQNVKENVSEKWRQLQEALWDKFSNPDKRRGVSYFASKLVDGRRNSPLSEDDVKLITALAAQFRRLDKADSVEARDAADFSAAVDRAIQRIQAVGQRPIAEAAE
jgi:hypothetical protein